MRQRKSQLRPESGELASGQKAQAADSAKALAAVVDIDAADYAAKVEGYGEEAFVDAITLREAAFEDLDQKKLDAIDGFLAVEDKLPLAPTRDFASAVLGSVREATAEDIEDVVRRHRTVGEPAPQRGARRRLGEQHRPDDDDRHRAIADGRTDDHGEQFAVGPPVARDHP